MTTGAGILPPDPLFSFRENMGHVHSLCFPQRNPDYSDLLLAGTEKGDVFFWDLEVSVEFFTHFSFIFGMCFAIRS